MYKIFYSLVVASLLAFGNAAHATVSAAHPTVYEFGKLLTADYAAPDAFASSPFAQLEATDGGSGVWTFKLTINNNLFSSFGSGAFIGSMTFDFNPDPLPKAAISTFIDSNVGRVTQVFSTTGTGGSGLTDIDFGTSFGRGAGDRLSQDDWVSWSVSSITSIQTH